MSKDLRIGLLNELYGKLLTVKQYEAVKNYYDYDYSLSEIAENLGVTRQAVRDLLIKGEAALKEYEDKLRVYEKTEKIKSGLDELVVILKDNNVSAAIEIADKIKNVL